MTDLLLPWLMIRVATLFDPAIGAGINTKVIMKRAKYSFVNFSLGCKRHCKRQ